MVISLKNNYLLVVLILLFISDSAFAQLVANAGPDQNLCPGASITIGGSPAATGGLAPYTYHWAPSSGLSSTTSPNPTASALADVNYTLTVTDDTGAVSTDVMNITFNYIQYVNAGKDTSICVNSHALIGGTLNVTGMGITYSWSPTTSLDNGTIPRPTSTPAATTTYTLTATVAGCPPKTDQVTVTVIPTPAINAGPDVTIYNGQTVTLHATGAYHYSWAPIGTLTYYYTPNPDAEPHITTTYIVYGTDHTGECPASDSVTVTVIPSDTAIFYNTFTPNGDGNNDTWYIGNIEKYPNNNLEVYNRNGRLVFKATDYQNTWDGKAFGEDLPAATYFYVMDLGDDRGKRHGTVTIIR